MLIQFKCIYIAPTQYNCYCLVSSVRHLISSDCASDNTACFPPASAFLVQHYTTHVVLNGVLGIHTSNDGFCVFYLSFLCTWEMPGQEEEKKGATFGQEAQELQRGSGPGPAIRHQTGSSITKSPANC